MTISSPFIFVRQALNLDGPALAPPIGQVPNFINPPDSNHTAIPVITVCTVLTAFSYFARFYAKSLTKKITVSDCEFIV